MSEPARCPRCSHANPPANRFCGSCGASLEAGSDLAPQRGNNLTGISHALPVKPGPVGKALAAALITLAVRGGLSWLGRRSRAKDRSSTLPTREHDTTVSEHLLGSSLEEILFQELLEGDYRSRTFAWRAVRSIVITKSTDPDSPTTPRQRG
jgi:hypothetical protein